MEKSITFRFTNAEKQKDIIKHFFSFLHLPIPESNDTEIIVEPQKFGERLDEIMKLDEALRLCQQVLTKQEDLYSIYEIEKFLEFKAQKQDSLYYLLKQTNWKHDLRNFKSNLSLH